MALQGIEVIGKIIKVYDVKSGVSKRTGNEWKSQEYVIEEAGNGYPRNCQFRVFGADHIEQFNIKVGDTVHVWLDINARPWEDRFITDISAYRVEHVDPNSVMSQYGGVVPPVANGAPVQGGAAQPASPQQPVAPETPDDSDGLPF